MKQIIRQAVGILLLGCTLNAISQTTAPSSHLGLYKNEDDFNLHKLSFEHNCQFKDGAIRVNGFSESPRLVVTADEKKTVLLKKDYFGYHDCNGKDYRFYHNQEFEIVDASMFYVYRHTALEPNGGG